MYNIGTKIKELRKRADMTQEQLADIAETMHCRVLH